MTRLDPESAPGHVNRKAREFAGEIARLRAEGYTLDAIRHALALAGVRVSLSTVWREARRRAGNHARPGTSLYSTSVPAVASASRAPSPQNLDHGPDAGRVPATPPPRSGKEVAEEFQRRISTNPLVRKKEQP